jgi:phosphoribosylformylglycinamidine cyclo-ligase
MSGTAWQEMYRVFNMGHRLEFYVTSEVASEIIAISRSFGIDAQVIGRVESAPAKEVMLTSEHGTFIYH